MTGIPLSEVLAELREEIKKAHAAGQDEEFRFALEEIDVELQVAVTAEAKGGAKLKFLVVDSEAGGAVSRHSLQKIHLKMVPVHSAPSAVMDVTLAPALRSGVPVLLTREMAKKFAAMEAAAPAGGKP